jgi:WhiB family redox-sensing transcriptional regulator
VSARVVALGRPSTVVDEVTEALASVHPTSPRAGDHAVTTTPLPALMRSSTDSESAGQRLLRAHSTGVSTLAELGAGLDLARRALAGLDGEERRELEATWRAGAACRGVDPEVFFPLGDGERLPSGAYAEARVICGGCDVRELCLAHYLAEQFGCWGGATPHERLLLRRQRGETSRARQRASA